MSTRPIAAHRTARLLQAIACSVACVGCESAPKAHGSGTGMPEPALRGMVGDRVSIPEGAGGDVAKRQLVVHLGIKASQDPKTDLRLSDDMLEYAEELVEAMLPRMKRFTVYAVNLDEGVRSARELSDAGIMKEVDETQLPAPDLYLNIDVVINTERNDVATKRQEWIVCTATVIYNLTDSSRKILSDTKYASGRIKTPAPGKGEKLEDMKNVRVRAVAFNTDTNKYEFIGGFKPEDPASMKSLVRQTMEDPLKGLVTSLALALPVTSEVTGLNPSKTQFSTRAGQRNGLFKGGKVVVWCDQGDFCYAIANAVAEPTVDKSNLKVVSWNDADPDAKVIIDRIRAGGIPDDLKGKIWATTEGVPLEEMLAP